MIEMIEINNQSARQPISSSLKVSSRTMALLNTYLPYLLIVIVITAGIVIHLGEFPLTWFDEGYTSHVAQLLITKGIYGTYTVTNTYPFDPFVSSGPGVVLPIALMFKLFGTSVFQARLAL